MKKWVRFELFVVGFALVVVLFECCTNVNANANEKKADPVAKEKPLSEEFKAYWYAGDAEITTYELEQARYGELRKGTAVMIFVTEPFLPQIQVKAENNDLANVPVLKLNATKNYLTGIYPYSIMSSTFYPVADNQHAIKTSLSIQEWCGHVYSQLNNRELFEFTSHSYFEGEADQSFKLEKSYLENEIWNKIRINPQDLPTGKISMIPSLEFFRVSHQKVKAFDADAKQSTQGPMSTYTIDYENGMRKLSINYLSEFPHTIESWSETYKSGFGANAKQMTSKASKIKSLKTPYWRQNSNKFVALRDSLGL
ncbi:MAG: septum formation inhibitor Maf [Croceitalea sp.]|nr:septum formation inhibitor Maf [Croceitalea sp.]NNL08878.1 septum formation inhibitor Maf [Croceitalea sp.]